jgi:hypothetical protein
MLDRLVSLAVALSLAFLVWLYVRSRDQETLDNVPIPVQITLDSAQSDNYELEVAGPSQIPVSFTGPASRMRDLRNMLQDGELRAEVTLTVPEDRLDESRYVESVTVETSDIHVPPGVTVILLEGRSRIPVTLYRIVDRWLPVRAEPGAGDELRQVRAEPPTVLVRGPQEVLERVGGIFTQPYVLPPHADPVSKAEKLTVEEVPLAEQIEGRRVRSNPATVTVHLTLLPRHKLYELSDVPVHFLCPANFPFKALFADERAGKMSVRVLGPAGEEAPAVIAFVDLSSRSWEPGLHAEPVKLQLPRHFKAAEDLPHQVAFQLVPLGSLAAH